MIINDGRWVLNSGKTLCASFRKRVFCATKWAQGVRKDFEGTHMAWKERFLPWPAPRPVIIKTGPLQAVVGLVADRNEACKTLASKRGQSKRMVMHIGMDPGSITHVYHMVSLLMVLEEISSLRKPPRSTFCCVLFTESSLLRWGPPLHFPPSLTASVSIYKDSSIFWKVCLFSDFVVSCPLLFFRGLGNI